MIQVEEWSKTFEVHRKAPGFWGSMKAICGHGAELYALMAPPPPEASS